MRFLQLSCAYHDSSILLAVDGGFIFFLCLIHLSLELDYMVVCYSALLGSLSFSMSTYTVL